MKNHTVFIAAETLARLVESADAVVATCRTYARMYADESEHEPTDSEIEHLKRIDWLLDEVQRVLDANK